MIVGKRLALGLLVAWAALGFLQEMNRAVAGYDGRAQMRGPWAWHFGTPETGDLFPCLASARSSIPPGSAVAFASDEPPEIKFQRWRWAAYLLPEDDVIPAGDPAAAQLATFAITFRTEIHDPRVEPLRQLPNGWLYRVKRP